MQLPLLWKKLLILRNHHLAQQGYVEPNVAVEEAVKTAILSGVSGQPDVYNTPEEIAEIEARLKANEAGEIISPDPIGAVKSGLKGNVSEQIKKDLPATKLDLNYFLS